jgi:hypothetical protein
MGHIWSSSLHRCFHNCDILRMESQMFKSNMYSLLKSNA